MMQSRRDIVTIIIFIATCSIFMITVCNGGELSESESESESKSFFNFSQSIDPKNVLRIDWNGFVPHPCSHQGVKCNFHGTTIRAIRLENLNLSGKIDTDSLCKLPNLQVLSLAQNHIQGNLPESISNCTTLKYLNLSNNLLNGSVPIGLSKLKSLRRFDISNNHFIEHLNYNASATLSLRFLNAFPPQYADQEAYPPVNNVSSTIDSKNQSAFVNWITWIPLVLCIGFYFLFIFFVNMKAIKLAKEKEILRSLAQSPAKTSPPPPPANDVEEVKPDERQSELVFFVGEEERFKMEDLLEAEADLQSQGLCSSLYKVKLKNNAVFAVKRLKKLQVSFEDFGETMSRIGNLGHPNILPLVGYNSTNEEKLLIYRYQSNGSLLNLQDNYAEGKRDFPWKLRISIAVGIAKGLNFIYHRSNDEEIIPHGNIKPSNILLNENEEPLISEYGFSKFLDPMRASLFNSNGYTAPEKSPSEQADVFSFGVILLEFLTGKTVEKSGLDLPRWVKSMVREEWTGEVFDKELTNVGMYAFPLLNVSLKCVAHFPENRPSIAEVVEKIEEVVHAQEDVSPSPISSVASSQQE
ncbi:unnamed protein product [Camellia sinensis]